MQLVHKLTLYNDVELLISSNISVIMAASMSNYGVEFYFVQFQGSSFCRKMPRSTSGLMNLRIIRTSRLPKSTWATSSKTSIGPRRLRPATLRKTWTSEKRRRFAFSTATPNRSNKSRAGTGGTEWCCWIETTP